ncbi:MAG TPA: hypothetical protein VGM52_12360 [Herbaspirillum sp.]|jgi:hypothetical protein
MNREWRITFSKLGQPESVIKAYPAKPSIETAARLIKNNVFGDEVPSFPYLPCDEAHIELSRLETHGWTIETIEECLH